MESSDTGKLYLNYPMVDAFYHMASIADPEFQSYYASLDELLAGKYKARVGRKNRGLDYRKFAKTRDKCSVVIRLNITKAWMLVQGDSTCELPPLQKDVLFKQLNMLKHEKRISVLSTCSFSYLSPTPN